MIDGQQQPDPLWDGGIVGRDDARCIVIVVIIGQYDPVGKREEEANKRQ